MYSQRNIKKFLNYPYLWNFHPNSGLLNSVKA
jgi:hypothetical protein